MDRSSTSGAGGASGQPGASRVGVESTGGAMEQTRSKVDEAKDSVKQELRDARQDVQRRAADTVNRQKHQVADRLDAITHALHAAQQSLREDEQSQLAGYVGDLTRQVERSTGYLRNNDFGGMMHDMERLARSNTGVFLGSTFIAGMAMGRFLRASEPEEPQGELAGYGTTGYGSTGYGGAGRMPGGLENAREFDRGDIDLAAAAGRRDDIGFAGTGRSRETESGEYRTGELGTDRPGGATGTRGSIVMPSESGLTGGSDDGSTRREER